MRKHSGSSVFMGAGVAALAGAYVWLLANIGRSASSAAIVVLGAAFVGAVAFVGLGRSPRVRRGVRLLPRGVHVAMATGPWLALLAAAAANALWWTQRPHAVRFFVVLALAEWSALWCLAARRSDATPVTRGSGRAVAALAIVLGALGIDGAAFGVMPFGCVLSIGLAAAAAILFAIACMGGSPGRLKAFVACVASLLAVAIVEVAVRALDIGHNVQEVDSREYAREFYSLTPPRSAFVNEPNTLDEFGPALIEINSLGIRGPELTDARADLLLIGDSMIEARQLAWPQTLGPRLQQALRARGLPWRVVAHGMRGWSPLLEWNWYLKVGRRLQPKIVLLFFFWNDLWTAGDEVSTFAAELDAGGRPQRFNLPVDSKWIWYKHVRVVRLIGDVSRRIGTAEVRRAFTTLAARRSTSGTLDDAAADRLARTLTESPLTPADLEALLTKPDASLSPELRTLARNSLWPSLRPWSVWTDAQKAAAHRTELELQRFSEDVKADGGRLVIVYVPNPLQVGPAECQVGRLFERVNTDVLLPPDSGIQTWLHDVSERHDIELLDPSPAMRAFDRDRPPGDAAPLYLRADCHWSERGHRFMADYLAEWCQRRGPRP